MLNIQENILLAPYTTFRIGGPAKYFVEVNSKEELTEAITYAKNNNLTFFILGGGSNVLVSDAGFDGLIIKNELTICDLQITTGIIEAGAGVSMAKLVKISIENSLSGLEWAAGLPGSLGGAIRGNAGTFGRSIKDIVENVKIFDLDDGKIREVNNNKCEFKYRSSIFKKKANLIILSAVLKLEKSDKKRGLKKMREILARRVAKQPRDLSAGSFFINPAADNPNLIKEFEGETGIKSEEKKIPAGWLIERADLKGKKIGGAMVSEKHANFIVNTGKAKAEDVIMLASFIKQQVRDKFGVELKEEVQYLGF